MLWVNEAQILYPGIISHVTTDAGHTSEAMAHEEMGHAKDALKHAKESLGHAKEARDDHAASHKNMEEAIKHIRESGY